MNEISNHNDQKRLMMAEEAASAVNELFKILACHIPYFQFSTNGNDYEYTKREWVKCLVKFSLNKKSLEMGIDRIRMGNFKKSNVTPNEFIALCRAHPEDIGAPSVELAYKEACRNSPNYETHKTWSHPVVRYAFNHVGSYNLMKESRDKTFHIFEEAYLDGCDLFQKGELKAPLPPPEDEISKNTGPCTVGRYEFVRPGILKQYERISSCEEAMAVLDNLLGKGNSGLKRVINNMRRKYESQGLV